MYFDLITDCNNSLSQTVIFYLSQDDLKLLVYKKVIQWPEVSARDLF